MQYKIMCNFVRNQNTKKVINLVEIRVAFNVGEQH